MTQDSPARVRRTRIGYAQLMPNKEPNPNRIRRQPKADSPPPPDHGARMAPADTTDWVEVGREEAEAQRRTGDAVPASHGNAPSRVRPSRAD
jgi:hypothetical protein